jgi:GNAT superfamily N-acetyltransferase
MACTLRFVGPDDPLFADASKLRYQTLHEPLGLPRDRDWNDADPSARHLIAVDGDAVLGYGRLILSPGTAQIRHVAVSPSERGRGLGRRLVEELVAQAKREGRAVVWVNARFTALGFWRSIGFSDADCGLIEAEDTHVPHKRMEMRLKQA